MVPVREAQLGITRTHTHSMMAYTIVPAEIAAAAEPYVDNSTKQVRSTRSRITSALDQQAMAYFRIYG